MARSRDASGRTLGTDVEILSHEAGSFIAGPSFVLSNCSEALLGFVVCDSRVSTKYNPRLEKSMYDK